MTVHDNGGHHDHTHGASERRIALAGLLTGLFLLVEVAGDCCRDRWPSSPMPATC